MSTAISGRHLGYVPAIDGLRAIAVLSVIFFHLNPALVPGGFVGVDIFFVISGFVVTGSLKGMNFPTMGALLLHFYARRLTRIMPALIVVLLATILLTALFIPKAWLSNAIPNTGIAAFFGVSNIALSLDTDGYFAPRAGFNPFLHTWSLGVEEQFYLLFPFLIYWYQRSKDGRSAKSAIIIIAALSAASLAICAWLTFSNWPWAFYLIPSRFWELGVGMLLSLTSEHWIGWVRAVHAKIVAVSLGLLALAFTIPETLFFPFPLALIPVIGAAGLIAAVCALDTGRTQTALASRPMVYIGKLSYSLYLWHWPVFVIFKWTVGLDSIAAALIALLLVFVCGAASYYLVETPLRTGAVVKKSPRPIVVGAALALTVASAFVGWLGFKGSNRLSLSVTRDHAVWYADPGTPLMPQYVHCKFVGSTEPFAGGGITTYMPKDCEIPRPAFRLFTIGDSHNAGYSPMFAQFAADTGVEVRSYFKSGCPFLTLLKPSALATNCTEYLSSAMDRLQADLRPGDVLFMPSLRVPRYVRQDETDAIAGAPDDALQVAAYEEARLVLAKLEKTGARLIFEAPTPVFKVHPFRCSDWFNRINTNCAPGVTVARAELEERREPAVASMKKLEAELPSLSRWDPFPLLCPQPTCSAMRGDKPLYFDSDHLSGYGNDFLYPNFRNYVLGTRHKIPVQTFPTGTDMR